MRADPTLIAHSAGVVLDGAAELAGMVDAFTSKVDLDVGSFGDLAGTAGVVTAYRACVDAAQALLDQLGQRFEADADRLYELAFGYRAVEQRAARRLAAAGLWTTP